MPVVSALALILSFQFAASHGAKAPSFVFLWQRAGFVGYIRGSALRGDAVATDKGALDLSTGRCLSPERKGLPSGGIYGPFDTAEQETILFQHKTLFLIWDTETCRIARGTNSWKLYQFRPKTAVLLKTVDRRLDDVGELWLSGDPDRGTLKIGSTYRGMSDRTVIEYLFLTNPLRMSPLRVCTYFDINRPEQGVLGAPLPAGKSIAEVARMPSSPDSPLILGDPLTGKILWKRSGYTNGHWIGRHWVLAQQTEGEQSWRILDGRTGRDAPIAVPAGMDDLAYSVIQTIGPYLLIYDPRGSIGTVAFRLGS
jgi:hypothetical protein